ncbi:MAG: hypothetical protein H5T62_16140, partial [Anaerolineae bacterium]|nr:hypothetical protein [Anaerolineae bacterium]
MNWNQKALNSCELIRETLNEALALARQHDDMPRIGDLTLDQVYVVVALDNGNQGVALNYQNALSNYVMDLDMRRTFAEYLLKQAQTDPLLTNSLLQTERGETLCEVAVAVAIASAVAQPYLTSEELCAVGLIAQSGAVPLASLVQEGDTVAVIGFGGYLPEAVSEPCIKRVLVAELNVAHPVPAARLRERVAAWKSQLRGRSFELHDGSHSADLIRQAQVACITGSALCNGTLAELLDAAHGCRTVIVQGHSVALHPTALLRRGAHYVVQPVIEIDLLAAARTFDQRTGDFARFIDRLLPRKRTISRGQDSLL